MILSLYKSIKKTYIKALEEVSWLEQACRPPGEEKQVYVCLYRTHDLSQYSWWKSESHSLDASHLLQLVSWNQLLGMTHFTVLPHLPSSMHPIHWRRTCDGVWDWQDKGIHLLKKFVKSSNCLTDLDAKFSTTQLLSARAPMYFCYQVVLWLCLWPSLTMSPWHSTSYFTTLGHFSYTLKFNNTIDHTIADALSRLPFPQEPAITTKEP